MTLLVAATDVAQQICDRLAGFTAIAATEATNGIHD